MHFNYYTRDLSSLKYICEHIENIEKKHSISISSFNKNGDTLFKRLMRDFLDADALDGGVFIIIYSNLRQIDFYWDGVDRNCCVEIKDDLSEVISTIDRIFDKEVCYLYKYCNIEKLIGDLYFSETILRTFNIDFVSKESYASNECVNLLLDFEKKTVRILKSKDLCLFPICDLRNKKMLDEIELILNRIGGERRQ